MTGLPRQSVWIAAALIVGLSLLGVYEGLQKSAQAASDDPAAVIGPATAAAAGANPATKTATALADPTPTVASLSESQIRSIVRQEVQAALTKESGPSEPEPLSLPTPRPLTIPPATRPADSRADAELLSGAGAGQ